jgi:stage 0 sporulation regulatory protein
MIDRNLISSLTEKITIKREEMINQAAKSGYTSNETIKASQELDRLLNNYQRLQNGINNQRETKPYINVTTFSFKRTSRRLKYSRLG